ncbi:fructosamine kinase family protein [Pseudonocardia spinosispora]|uniref:fructosamine kinase family protein n=1 Tax=Pseudonocardia spinosispora TaxID=103441 RepID=UPI0003F70B42
MSDEPADVVRRLSGVDGTVLEAHGTVLRMRLADGRIGVLKAAPGQALAEAAGLRWLAEPGVVPVPDVFGHDEDWLLVEYLPGTRPGAAAATRFGHDLAALHSSGAPAFGAGPPGGPEQAWIGPAPMDTDAGDHWPSWYAEHRVLPYLRMARDAGSLDTDETHTVEAAADTLRERPAIAGPPVPPARLHGDLWSGNVLWSGTRAWVIDPAAHGGHPETDLAMLALFGAPELRAILAGYQEVAPLAPGWPERIGLHQLFPLLVHVVLFGGTYSGQAVAAARSVLELADRIP